MFISFLYMFRATMCPSSGEITVSMRHLVLVTLYGWLPGMQGGIHHAYQTVIPQSDKYQVSHRYSYFSWWWAHSRPKHVEKRNKHTKKICAPSWLYLQGYTRMQGQQNITNAWITFRKSTADGKLEVRECVATIDRRHGLARQRNRHTHTQLS